MANFEKIVFENTLEGSMANNRKYAARRGRFHPLLKSAFFGAQTWKLERKLPTEGPDLTNYRIARPICRCDQLCFRS